jgi:protein-S-isoprenylcysteine O-methyltransferase Ste14
METTYMEKSKETSKASPLSAIAAVLILSNAVALGVVARWFIGIMPVLPGSSGNDPMVLYWLSAIGVAFGTVVLLGTIMVQRMPSKKKFWGGTIVAFSLPTIIMGGGFIVGFLLGIFGGVSAISGKPKMKAMKTKLPFLKMTDEMGMKIEGAGPKIMAPLFVTFAATAGLSWLYQPMLNYPAAFAYLTLTLGVVLLAIGLPFWLLSAAMFLKAWQQEKLETRGPFAIMPNPIYSSFVVFVIPGVSLLLGWWPILLTSVAMFVAQRMFIKEEDDILRKKFDKQYMEYRKRVLIKFL